MTKRKATKSLNRLSRRNFLKKIGIGIAGGAVLKTGLVNGIDIAEAQSTPTTTTGTVSDSVNTRIANAKLLREKASQLAFSKKLKVQTNNQEETDYPYVATYTKGLPSNELAEVTLPAYKKLSRALTTGNPQDFERLSLGSKKLKNPLAGLAYNLEGYDSQQLFLKNAPRIDEPQNSSELAELYWMAICRDIRFSDYAIDSTISRAVNSLNAMSDFTGPKVNGAVTPATIFKGGTSNDLVGPFISQFLFKDIVQGQLRTKQSFATFQEGIDYLTSYAFWLHRQQGGLDGNTLKDLNGAAITENSPTRYIITGRDLAAYVHLDEPLQAFYNAAFILFNLGVPYNSGNPYRNSFTSDSFGTLGSPNVLALVGEVSARALKAAWYQKWYVHRRLRPETFSGRVHNHKTFAATYAIDNEILNSDVLGVVFAHNQVQNQLADQNTTSPGTYLLPQAYPEGSPLHPAYPSGHATVAGACATILKAFFDGTTAFPNPVVPNADGSALVSYAGSDASQMTVGGELDKLASNIPTARNFAGIHWRTDMSEGLKLGEAVAIQLLREHNLTYIENNRFVFKSFAGKNITIRNKS